MNELKNKKKSKVFFIKFLLYVSIFFVNMEILIVIFNICIIKVLLPSLRISLTQTSNNFFLRLEL